MIRELTEEDLQDMERIRREYIEKAQYYKNIARMNNI